MKDLKNMKEKIKSISLAEFAKIAEVNQKQLSHRGSANTAKKRIDTVTVGLTVL